MFAAESRACERVGRAKGSESEERETNWVPRWQQRLQDRVEQLVALIDERREMVKAYGVWHRFGVDAWNISRPAVFLINQDGTVQYSFISDSQREFPSQDQILHAAG